MFKTYDHRMHNGQRFTLHVRTNGHERELVSWYDLPGNVRTDWFGYVTGEDRYTPRFVSYLGGWYDTGDLEPATSDLRMHGWDGMQTLTMQSGVAFKFFDVGGYERDGVVCAYFYVSD